jgi:hypothetical protein
VFDLAKSGNSSAGVQFVNNLKSEGTPSRVMWKSVEKFYPLVQAKVMRTINAITNSMTAEIAAETHKRNAQSIRASQQVRTALGRFGKAF